VRYVPGVGCRARILDKVKSLRKSWRQDIRNSREINGEAMSEEKRTRRYKV